MEKRWADRYNDVINRNKSSSASSTASSPAVKKTRQRHLKTAATDAASPPASVTETIKQKPPHVEFMDRFKAFYERITSQPFNDDKKHYAMADRLVRKHGLEAVIAKAKTLGFLCRDRSAWFAKGGFADFTIEKLSSQWNSILVEAAQPTKEQKGRDEEEQARKKWEAHNARVDSILKRGGSNSNRGGVGEVVPVAGSTATEREESPVDSGDR